MTVDTFINNFVSVIVNPTIIFLFSVALLIFIWGIVEFIRQADNESERATASRHIIWGLVGMAIMVSAISIKNILASFWN